MTKLIIILIVTQIPTPIVCINIVIHISTTYWPKKKISYDFSLLDHHSFLGILYVKDKVGIGFHFQFSSSLIYYFSLKLDYVLYLMRKLPWIFDSTVRH